MVAHHALAALASFLLLRHGAAAIGRALQSLGLALARVLQHLAPPPLLPSPRLPLESAETLVPSAVVVLGGAGRRGPPAVALAR